VAAIPNCAVSLGAVLHDPTALSGLITQALHISNDPFLSGLITTPINAAIFFSGGKVEIALAAAQGAYQMAKPVIDFATQFSGGKIPKLPADLSTLLCAAAEGVATEVKRRR